MQTPRKKNSTGTGGKAAKRKAKKWHTKKAIVKGNMKAGASNKMKRQNIAPKSKPTWKQAPKSLSGGRWRGNDQGQGSWGLNYEYSQRVETQASPNFSSFFAPSNSRSEQSKSVELGLLIRKHWVGGLIGKKGKTIWMIRDKSNGANIDFGNDDIIIDRSNDKKWEQSPWPENGQEKYNVCAISGLKDQAAEAAKAIAEHMAKSAQSPKFRLEFLIPNSYVGVFIGKKGANLKKIKGAESDGISINIRGEPILLGNNKVTICTLFGPAETMPKAIERTAKWLGEISIKVVDERETQQFNRDC